MTHATYGCSAAYRLRAPQDVPVRGGVRQGCLPIVDRSTEQNCRRTGAVPAPTPTRRDSRTGSHAPDEKTPGRGRRGRFIGCSQFGARRSGIIGNARVFSCASTPVHRVHGVNHELPAHHPILGPPSQTGEHAGTNSHVRRRHSERAPAERSRISAPRYRSGWRSGRIKIPICTAPLLPPFESIRKGVYVAEFEMPPRYS